jgi:hypothetical protein
LRNPYLLASSYFDERAGKLNETNEGEAKEKKKTGKIKKNEQ